MDVPVLANIDARGMVVPPKTCATVAYPDGKVFIFFDIVLNEKESSQAPSFTPYRYESLRDLLAILSLHILNSSH